MASVFDDFDDIQCEEVYPDPDPELDEEEMEEWSDYDALPYDEDEDSVLIDENGGITAEGMELLAELDSQGYFV